jgi:hypothetical protein
MVQAIRDEWAIIAAVVVIVVTFIVWRLAKR